MGKRDKFDDIDEVAILEAMLHDSGIDVDELVGNVRSVLGMNEDGEFNVEKYKRKT